MTAPDLSKHIVSARTMKALRQILLEPKYRLDKPGLPLCVWTDSESTLPAFLNQLGYRNVTHVTHLEQAPEPGLLICDGDADSIRMKSGNPASIPSTAGTTSCTVSISGSTSMTVR
jgi:hypothetical protein